MGDDWIDRLPQHYSEWKATPVDGSVTPEERRRAERLELASRIQVAIVGGYWSDPTTEPYISTDDGFPGATKETARIAIAHADALLDALVAKPEDE